MGKSRRALEPTAAQPSRHEREERLTKRSVRLALPLAATFSALALLASSSLLAQVPSSSVSTAPITKAQARDLFRSVDEIAQFVSRDSDLPIDHTIKRALVSREQINLFLKRRFDSDEGAKRLERSEIVLKKFGLLDRDFQLRPFLISLLTEQIAGYYDDHTKTVNLLNWIEPDEQRPVLAHELTHALQDQSFNLRKWSDVEAKGNPNNVDEDNHHLALDEDETAREAVTEGQAMVVYVDYSLRSSGRTLADTPELGDKLKQLAKDTSGSPVMARAPLLLQQSLLFPYSDGLAFEQAVLIKSGKNAAFAGVLTNPPSSSYQIIHPKAYLAHKPVPLLHMPDIHPLIDAEYTPYDVGVMGELDVRILTELFGGPQQSAALTPAWRGGLYYAAQHRSAITQEQKSSPASLGLLYLSAWQNDDSARSFERLYAAELPRKYANLVRRENDEIDPGEQVYSTEEGDVLLTRVGSSVFISEGFALPLARTLRDRIVAAQTGGPGEVVSNEHVQDLHGAGELTLTLSRSLARMGTIKAALQGQRAIERYTLGR